MVMVVLISEKWCATGVPRELDRMSPFHAGFMQVLSQPRSSEAMVT